MLQSEMEKDVIARCAQGGQPEGLTAEIETKPMFVQSWGGIENRSGNVEPKTAIVIPGKSAVSALTMTLWVAQKIAANRPSLKACVLCIYQS